MFLYMAYYLLEAAERFGGLRIECHRSAEIHFFQFRQVFNHYGFPSGLSHESVHFGMSLLSVDHNLRTFTIIGFERFFDALL